MKSPDNKPKTFAEEIEEERLRAWREKRAKIAETSRQERLKQVDEERRKRVEEHEKDKARRVKEAAERRAKELADQRAQRLATARARIAGRSDLEAARKRLLAYRKQAAIKLALKTGLFVIAPTLLVAGYLFFLATPFYASHVQLALTPPPGQQVDQALTPLASNELARETHLLREVIYSAPTLALLNEKNGFDAHFSGNNIDRLTKLLPSLSGQDEALLQKHIKVVVNGQNGLISIEAKATDPETAEAFVTTVLERAQTWIKGDFTSQGSVSAPAYRFRTITPLTTQETATFPKKANALAMSFFAFLAVFAIGSIFFRTLLRHSQH